MRDGLVRQFVPMLDGERLLEDPDGGLFHADGRPVDPQRRDDIVYLKPAEREEPVAEAAGWWHAVDNAGPKSREGDAPAGEVRVGEVVFTPRDVSEMLVAVAGAHEPSGPVGEVDAGFFHRTLVRWMGMDDDDAPGVAPRWDYRFWKAELHLEGELNPQTQAVTQTPELDDDDSSNAGQTKAWTAEVWRGEDEDPERYRYWVAFDPQGLVASSGWLSAAPDLLAGADDDDGAGFHAGGADLDVIERALDSE